MKFVKELSALVEHKTTSTTFAVKNLEKLYNLNASQALVKPNAQNENNGEYSTGLGHGKVCLFLFLYSLLALSSHIALHSDSYRPP